MFFDVNPTDTDAAGGSVTIAAASSGNKARFIALGFSNDGTAQRTLRIYDGSAATGTIRFRIALGAGSGDYYVVTTQAGKSILPKIWFTAGSQIQADLSGTGSVRIFGEIVREP